MQTHKKYNTPKIKESRGVQLLTTIWLVPLIAMIIALWLAYQYYAKIGPTIKINFKSNAGLIANQSQLKLRDVTIGVVSKISLSDDGAGVTVEVRVNKEVAKYLNEKAKFWIVHPDVGSHGVSGLDTLLSGSYIGLYGVKERETKHEFIGLEKPYIDRNAEGEYYLLSAPNSNNIAEGSLVYYRMIKVGSVERVGITPDGKKVNFTIFVNKKYTKFINKHSQFYTNSSFSLDFSKGKIDMNMASLSQLAHGGISIYTPVQTIEQNRSIEDKQKQVFPLYKSLSEMKAKHLMTGAEEKVYTFNFEESTERLEIGSAIEYNGFQVGYVTDIKNHFVMPSKRIKSTVYAIIYTKAFASNQKQANGEIAIGELVSHGLKASLNSSVPIVGSDFIDLIFRDNRAATLDHTQPYPDFPTTKRVVDSNILTNVKTILVKLEKLPLEQLVISATKILDESNKNVQELLKELKRTSKNFDSVVSNLNTTISNVNSLTGDESLQNLPNELSITMSELTNTLLQIQELSRTYSANSIFSEQLSLTLKELTQTAESMGRISLKLEKKPNALILGDD